MSKSAQISEREFIVQVEPWIDHCELQELTRAIASTFITENELTREFENSIAQLTGAKHAIAVCNGTLALFVCLKALGIGPGDEVIVPDLTFIASANAVILAGATPVLCDVHPETFCIEISCAERLRSKQTRAIMPVHLYGQSADMSAVLAFARKNNLRVIEDAAEGIGVRYDGRHVGTFGDMGILSFYGNKTVTCGEGGIVLTNDDALAQAAYRLKNYGRDQKGIFIHESIGFNFSFSDLHAAVGIAQLKKMSRVIAKKKSLRDRYAADLQHIPEFRPAQIAPQCQPVFWFSCFLCDEPEALSVFLAAQRIQTRRFFYPLHLQPCFADRRHVRNLQDGFPVSESLFRRGICLPSSYSLSEEGQSRVIEQIRRFYAHRN